MTVIYSLLITASPYSNKCLATTNVLAKFEKMYFGPERFIQYGLSGSAAGPDSAVMLEAG